MASPPAAKLVKPNPEFEDDPDGRFLLIEVAFEDGRHTVLVVRQRVTKAEWCSPELLAAIRDRLGGVMPSRWQLLRRRNNMTSEHLMERGDGGFASTGRAAPVFTPGQTAILVAGRVNNQWRAGVCSSFEAAWNRIVAALLADPDSDIGIFLVDVDDENEGLAAIDDIDEETRVECFD